MITAPVRVLHVLEALEGGTARHLADLVRHARATEHHVAVPLERVGWVTDRAAVEQMRDAGAEVHLVDMRRTPLSPVNLLAVRAIRRVIARTRPQVVHGHSSVGGALARIAATGGRRPRVYTPNGVATGRVALAVERALAPLTDQVVAVSASEGELTVRLHLAEPTRVTVIPNGIDLDEVPEPVDLRSMLGVARDVPLVGTIARLVAQKAPEDFVTACGLIARDHAAAQFVLIGAGPEQAAVHVAVGTQGLEGRFHHLPNLERAAAVLGDLDVFLLTSRFEGGPYSPLEAMRAGTPVVVSDAVGNRDAVVDGVSGVIVPVGDVLGYARAVVALLDDPARRAALIQGARKRLASHFDVRSMGRAHDGLYARLTS